jgi:hypothetical protein
MYKSIQNAGAQGYIGKNQDAVCFAAATDVDNLKKCYAIMVTGGEEESEVLESDEL